jgi:uncharacterized membrane protein
MVYKYPICDFLHWFCKLARFFATELSKDLQEVIDVIRGQNGMITQKDLCSRLKYSEVKVSLMLSNLEKRKRIKKFKRGRENLVVLMDEKC